MSRWPESNRRPTRYECVALPAELHRHINLVTETENEWMAQHTRGVCAPCPNASQVRRAGTS